MSSETETEIQLTEIANELTRIRKLLPGEQATLCLMAALICAGKGLLPEHAAMQAVQIRDSIRRLEAPEPEAPANG